MFRLVLPVEVRLVTEVEASVELPVMFNDAKNAEVAERIEAKKEVEVALVVDELLAIKLVIIPLDMVVVANELNPVTVKLPVLVVEARSERKLVFSTQLSPFQKSVEPDMVPEAKLGPPETTLIHFVEVPVEESTCPNVPVAPIESISP